MARYFSCWLGLALLALLAGQGHTIVVVRVSSSASLFAALQNQDVQQIWLQRGISLDGRPPSAVVLDRNVTVEPAPELRSKNATVPLVWTTQREPRLHLRPGVTLLLRFLELHNMMAPSGLPHVFGVVARSPGARLQLEGCLSPQQYGLGVPAMLQITRSLPRAGSGSVGSSAATPGAAAVQQATYAVPPGALCYSQGQLAAATAVSDAAASSSNGSVEVWRVCVPYEAQLLADVSFEAPTTGLDGDAASALLGTASGSELLGGYTVQMTDHVIWVEHPVSEECTRTRPVAVCIHELSHELASADNSSQSQSIVIALAVVAPCAGVALVIAAAFACLYMRQRRARKAAAVATALAATEGAGHDGRGASGSSHRSGDAGGGHSGGKATEDDRDDVESGLGGDTVSSSSSSDGRGSAGAKGAGAGKDVLFSGFEDAQDNSTPTWRAAPIVRALDRCSAASCTSGAQALCAAEQPSVCDTCGGHFAMAAACDSGPVVPVAAAGPAGRPTVVSVHPEIEPAATNGVSDCGDITHITTCRCSTATESMASRTASVQHHSLQQQVLLGRHSATGGAPPNGRPSSASAAAGAGLGKVSRAPLPGGAVVVTLRPDQPRLAAALQALQQAHCAAVDAAPFGAGAAAAAAAAATAEPGAAARNTDNSISLMTMVRSMSSGGQPHNQAAAGPAVVARTAGGCLQEDVASEQDGAGPRAGDACAHDEPATGSPREQRPSGLQQCQYDTQLQVPSLQNANSSTGAPAPIVPSCTGGPFEATSACVSRQVSTVHTHRRMEAINERAQHTSTGAVGAPTSAFAQDITTKKAMSSIGCKEMQPIKQHEACRSGRSADGAAQAIDARAGQAASPLHAGGSASVLPQPAQACAASWAPTAPSDGVSRTSSRDAAAQPCSAAVATASAADAAGAAAMAAAPQEAAAPAQPQTAEDAAGPPAAPGAARQQQAGASAPGGAPMPGSRRAAQLEGAAETVTPDDAPATAGDVAGADGVQRSGSKMDLVLAELEEMKRSHAMEVKDVQLRLVELLGEGAFGVVYKGQWQGLDVAVKTVIFNSLGTTRKAALAEAALSSAVCHSNVVATYLVDVQPLFTPETAAAVAAAGDGVPGASGSVALDYRLYIVQEFCDAGTLRQLILSGRLHEPMPSEDAAAATAAASSSAAAPGPSTSSGASETAAAAAAAQRVVESVHGAVRLAPMYEIALGISRALGHLHAKGIVHSDLSAANVLLKRDPGSVSGLSAKIADFGLSVMIPKHLTHLSGRRCGSPFYIAPEVYQRGHASPAADIFAFGVLLWELVMGTSAGVVDETTGQFQYSKLFPLLPGPRSCPPPLRQLVHACLQRAPSKRPSATQVTLLLERLLTMELKKAAAGAAGPAAGAATTTAAAEAGASAAPAAVASAGAAKGDGVPAGAGLAAMPPPMGAVAV